MACSFSSSVFSVLQLLAFLSSPVAVTCRNNRTVLCIGAFYPLTMQFSGWGAGCKPAAELAVQDLNARTDILQEYELRLETADTQSTPSVAIREFIRMLQSPNKKIMLLGPFPSHLAIAVAQTARWYNLIQVSPAAFTPELSDRTRFPYFYRTRAALNTFNNARVEFVKRFGWKRVAIITRHTNYFIQTADLLASALKASNITVVALEVFQNNERPAAAMDRIKGVNARIIFVFSYEEYARKIFCEAFKRGLYGKRYVWIMHFGNDPMWMTKPTGDGSCSAQEIMTAAEGHVITSDVTVREDNVHTIYNMTPSYFVDRYETYARNSNVTPATFYAPLTYDAVWAMALALNASLSRLPVAKTLADFSYENNDFIQVFKDEMNKLNFEGLSGTIVFSNTGNIASLKTKIRQFKALNFIDLGQHDSLTKSIHMKHENIWGDDGFVPFDDIRIVQEPLYSSKELWYTVTAISIGGFLLSFYCLWFNISHRKLKIIKMSSPNLNNVIIVGCLFAYASTILYGIDLGVTGNSAFLIICKLRMVVLAIGFSLGFGALFAKTWRVFLIFTNKRKQKIVIQDKKLVAMVSFFVLLDLVFFLIWFFVDPIKVVVKVLTDQALVYVMKGVLIVFGVFLAWQTRSVKIAALNDSKYIGFAVYNVMTLCLLVLPATFVLVEKQMSIQYGILSAAILICTITTEVLVFFPKIFAVKRGTVEPEETSTMKSAAPNTTGGTSVESTCHICKAKIRQDATNAAANDD